MIRYTYDILVFQGLNITTLRKLMNDFGQKGIKVKVLHIQRLPKASGYAGYDFGDIILQTTQEVASPS